MTDDSIQRQVPNEAEDTARLLQLIEDFRDETVPFGYSLEEPNIPNAEYQQIRTWQKEVHELIRLGQNQEGYRRARELLELVAQYYQKAHPVALSAYNNVAIFLRRSGRLGEAKSILVTVYEGYTRVLGPAHLHSVIALSNLAAVYKTLGEIDTAKTLYSEAVQRGDSNAEVPLSVKLNLRSGLAGCLGELGQAADALGVLDAALAEWDRLQNPTAAETLTKAQLLQAKGLACKRLQRYVDAEQLYLQALKIREELLQQEHPEVLAACHNLAELYGLTKQEEKAAEYHARVLLALKGRHQGAV